MPGPLHGLRVIETATGVAGAYCGKLLAGFGAEVIKVEAPEGDALRREGPFPGDLPDPEKSGLFLHLNTGKRSVVLPAGLGIDSLLAGADVLITSDPRDASLSTDALIVAAVTPFGLTGPYASFAGGELVTYALSGYMSLTGAPDREPLKAYGQLIQYQAGAHLALGVAAALLARETTGRGQLIDCSAMESGTFLLGGVEQNAYFYGVVARRNGTRLMGFPPQHSYPSTIRPCKDGFVHAHSNNRYLDLLGAMIPHPRLSDPDLLHAMMGHADEIDAIMDDWLAGKTREEIVPLAQSFRLPFTEVRTPGEVLREEHHQERGSFVTVNHPGYGPLLQPGAPIRMSATPWRTSPAPTLGAGTGAIAPWPAISQRPTASSSELRRPLSGVRIIDFTNAVAGPIASSVLAALGAEVIKVEALNGRPRKAAGTAPLLAGAEDRGWDRMMLFNGFNHGKIGLSLDVTKPAGRDIFLKLAAQADVVVQNFAPRVMPNLALAYEDLRAVNEDIILVSMPAFGLSGPYRDRISYGPGIDAMSGLSHLTGYQDGPPLKPGNFFCDQNAAIHAAFATCTALLHRNHQGEGQHVELPMIEGEFQVLGDAYIDFVMNGRERMRSGNDHPSRAPHGVFPCAGDDRWLAIAVETDAQWGGLCSVIGNPALADDRRFATSSTRHANRAELVAPISTWTSVQDHYAAMHALQAAGVPAAAVLDAGELLTDPHIAARHGFEFVDTPGVGPTPYARVAFTLSDTPIPLERPAPAFGGANDYVLRELLGLSAAEIGALKESGVVSDEPIGSGAH